MATCPSCAHENRDAAKYCEECATPLAARRDRAERKVVTVLFCDLVGSTSLGERYDPEVLRPALRAYFDEARAAVERHGGRVEKYIGDAIAAVFGMPTVHEDDALRAVRAAAEIQERMRAVAPNAPVPIECRIGVNTGEVLASGDDTPLVGDAMNTAARLQSAASPGWVLLGEPTYRLVRDAVLAEAEEPIVAKGKAEPVAAYRLLEVLDRASGTARRLDSPLVGRVRELRLLADALQQALSDASVHLVTLVGPAGIGKTRLVEEFMRTSAADAAVVRGRCLAYGEGITYWPVAEIVREAAGVTPTDDLDLVREKVAKLLPSEDPERDVITERVSELLGLGGRANAEETVWAVRRFLEALAVDRPLVCVIEDLHWAEPGLLDLIDRIADRSREVPILLLCDARPEFLEQRPTWAGGKLNATTLALQPLSSGEVDELIANLLGEVELPNAVRARVQKAAEGNPLFVEQLLAMLAEQGALTDGRWTGSATEDLAVPATISALLVARLDRLGNDERTLLQAAAVEGKSFSLDTVATLTGIERGVALGLLEDMVRQELVRPERAAAGEGERFRFRHILICDAAYETLPKARRADHHARLAKELEEAAADRIGELHEILGHHYATAHDYLVELGRPDGMEELATKASGHLGEAGARLDRRGDTRGAVGLVERALGVFPPLDERGLPLLVLLAIVASFAGDMDRSRRAFAQLREVAARTLSDPYLRIAEALGCWYDNFEGGGWDPVATQRAFSAAIEAAREAGIEEWLVGARSLRAEATLDLGDIEGAIVGFSEAAHLAASGGHAPVFGNAATSLLGTMYSAGRSLPEILDRAEQLVGLSPGRAARAWVTLYRELCLAELARPYDAVGAIGSMRRAFSEIQDPWDFVNADCDAVRLALAVGQLDLALACAQEAAGGVWTGERHDNYSLAPGWALAMPLLANHRDDEALTVTDRMVELPGVGDPLGRAMVAGPRAVALARCGRLEEASALIDGAVADLEQTRLVRTLADLRMQQAEVRQLAGDLDGARAAALAAREVYAAMGSVLFVAKADAFLDALEA